MKFDAKQIIKETEDESDREEYTMKNIPTRYTVNLLQLPVKI